MINKNKIYKFITIYITLFFFITISNNVLADETGTLSLKYIDGYYYTMTGGNAPYMSYPFPFYQINNEVVYCIEPGVNITDNIYLGKNGYTNSPYNDYINNQLELIGHYGYNYPNHQSIKYRLATQALIWNITGNRIIEFWTKQYGYGTNINIDKEKKEIMNLVNNHNLLPSFNNSKIDTLINKEIILEDTNNVLNHFEIQNSPNHEIKIKNNKLYITPKSSGPYQIILTRIIYDDQKTTIFTGLNDKSTQKVGKFRTENIITGVVNINTIAPTITIKKLDSETKKNSPISSASLKGAIYGIYDEFNQLIDTLITNESGISTSKELPTANNLFIKEISPPYGYKLDPSTYHINITIDNPNPTISLYEESIKKKIIIKKLYGSKTLGDYKPEPNITFDIYLKSNNTYITSITTNNQGIAEASLPYGTYLLKQKNTTENYTKIEDLEITIDDRTQETTTKTIYNYAYESKVKIIKIDSETKEPIHIKGIKFKIKNTKTNEYICQFNNCEFQTDEYGTITTPILLFGNYQLEEIENQLINNYLWNKETYNFSIDEKTPYIEDSEKTKIYTIYFPNERVKGKIIINKFGEEIIFKNNNYIYHEIPLKNVRFALYANTDITINNKIIYQKDTLIKEITTDEEGKAIIDNLELGKYYIKEISTDTTHAIDNNKYEFTLSYQDKYTKTVTKTINLKNYYKKGSLEITKVDNLTNAPIPNTTIALYTTTNQLVNISTTNEDGKILIDDLFIGKFYITELTPSKGYTINTNKLFFELTNNNQSIKLTLKNEKITSKLEITKVDFLNNNPLKNTEIAIYDDQDQLIKNMLTNENGKIIIDKLPYGNYYIIEKTPPEGYILSNEKIPFSITTNNEIIKITLKNEKIVHIPNTIKNDYSNYLFLTLSLLGGLFLYYAKKKK